MQKFNDNQLQFISRAVWTQQIIAVSLPAGVLVFLAIVLTLIPGEAPNDDGLLITYVAVGMAMVMIPISLIIPRFLGGSIREALMAGDTPEYPQQYDPPEDVGPIGPLAWLFQTRMIVGLALLEGAAFFNAIAYMLERQEISLVTTLLLVAAMFFQFPTRTRMESWLQDELKRINEIRSLQT